MQIDFSNFSAEDRPILILKNAHDAILGVLGSAYEVSIDATFNEMSTLSFKVPFKVDGEETPLYDKIESMRIVELRGIGQFIINKVTETADGVNKFKDCSCYSLEYELSRKKITIPKGTYKFSSASASDETLMNMVMEELPSWNIGEIPASLANKYRTYEISNTTIYDFLKNTVQESYNCIFTFDTINREINLIDAQNMPTTKQVFLSTDNLAKEIKIEENADNIVTRLDVQGAEDVNIRDVNPTGTNRLVDLSYYMTTDNFDQDTIDAYNAWTARVEASRDAYYMLTLQYSAESSLKISQTAELTELKGEMTSLENLRGVAIQQIAEGIDGGQAALDAANAQIRAKKSEITAQEALIAQTEANIADYKQSLQSIVSSCSMSNNFTSEQIGKLDKYYKDGEIQDSSFTLSDTNPYTGVQSGTSITSKAVSFSGGNITRTTTETGRTIYDIDGGTVSVNGLVTAYVVSAIVELSSGSTPDVTLTSYLNAGTFATDSQTFPSGCMTISGTASGVTSDCTQDPEVPTIYTGTQLSLTANGYYYFSTDTSEYQKRRVAYELYEYGREMLTKLAQPTYSFDISSANFLAAEGFETFKNALSLGDTVYVQLKEGQVIKPICIGVNFSYKDLSSLTLKFSNSFVSSDSVFRLTDLLKDGVSTSKTVDSNKYAYAEWVDKHANNELLDYMNSALDVSKNAILSSEGQAITWDDAGIRLRKTDGAGGYDDEQIWMNNNSIVMTDDGWNSASLAIGRFKDSNTGGTYWGVNAGRIYGSIIAGSNLWIESEAKSGGTSLFRVDGSGVYLYNSQINMVSGQRQVLLNPDVGIVIGKNPVLKNGAINTDNAYFYAEANGNLHIKGDITATSGTFSGTVYASDGSFSGAVTAQTLNLTTSSEKTIKDLISAAYIRAQTSGMYTYTGSTDPSPGSKYTNGDTYYNTTNHSVWRYNGTKWIRVTPRYTSGPAVPTSDIISGDRWRCTTDPSVTSNNKTYYYNNVYEYTGSEWVGTSGEVTSSSVDILPDRVDIKTGKFNVFIQTDVNTEPQLQIDLNGVSTGTLTVMANSFSVGNFNYKAGGIAEVYTGDTVIYCGGSATEAVSAFNSACDDLCDKYLKEDVVIKVPWQTLLVKPVLRNVSGARVIISPYNLMDSDASHWILSSATVSTGQASCTVTASTAGTYRRGMVVLGTVSSLGLLGKTLYFGATVTQSGTGARGQMAIALYRKGPVGGQKYSILKYIATSTAGTLSSESISGYVDIPARDGDYKGMEDAEVALILYASAGTECAASAYVRYTNCCVTIGGGYLSNNFPGAWNCNGALIDNCSSQIIFVNAVFAGTAVNRNNFGGYLSAMNSNYVLNGCTLPVGFASNGDITFNSPPGIQQYGGSGSLWNCGGGKADTVYAEVRGGGLLTLEGSRKPNGVTIGHVVNIDGIPDGSGGTPPPDKPQITTGQKKFDAANTGTYWSSGWANADNDVRQGSMTSNMNMKGWVLFNISGLPSGYSLTSAKLKFKRTSGYGRGGAVDVAVYRSTTLSKSGEPATTGSALTKSSYIDEGETKTLDITDIFTITNDKFAVVFKVPNESLLRGKTYSSNFARFRASSFELILDYTYPAT